MVWVWLFLKALYEKGLIEEIKNNTVAHTQTGSVLRQPALTLNSEQQNALDNIRFNTFNVQLLDGVTGSGKTEVYLQAIEKVLKHGQQVLVLVPEIGLTPQTIERFKQRFNYPVASLHSGVSDKKRLTTWVDAKAGKIPIIIGTRSAIFTPLEKLGLIVIDEEHDLSYKQQEGVRYSAREVAIVRAQHKQIPIILGSATPSLETLYNATQGRFSHQKLRQRAANHSMPTLQCVEQEEETLSPYLLNTIKHRLEQEQQVLVFINRRGYSPTLICKDCGWISQCHNCDSRMTLHKGKQGYTGKNAAHLRCHHCDTKASVPHHCPQCYSTQLESVGQGTQRSEEQLLQHFQSTPVIRIDRDSVQRKGELEQNLAIINKGEPCILVGTQMLAKGHHFAKVALVVVLGLDDGFFSSDFRGPERMAQLLTQVSGRAGRENTQGQVVIQTQFSQHPLLQTLINQGYPALAEQLLYERLLTSMPPYQYLALIKCHAHQPGVAMQFLQEAKQLAQHLERVEQEANPTHQNTIILGPMPATMEKRNNRYFYHLQIKAPQRRELHTLLNRLCHELERKKTPTGLHWLIDVDPLEF